MNQQVQKVQRVVLFLIMVLFWFSLYAHVPYQTKYLEGLGVPAGGIGLIVGMYGVAQFLLRLPLGMSADRTRSFLRYVLLGVSLTLLTAILRMSFLSAGGMLVANLLAGFAATNWIVLLVFFLQLFPQEALQYGMTSATLSFALGQMLATWVGSLVFRQWGMVGLAKAEVLASGIAVVLGYGLFVYLRVLVGRDRVSSRQAGFAQPDMLKSIEGLTYRELWRSLWRKRTLGFAFLAFIQQGLIMTTALSFTTKHALAIGANEVEIGYATLIFLGLTVLVNFLLGRSLFIRLGARRLLPFFLSLAAVYCFMLPFVQTLPQLYMMQCLGGVFSGGTLPLILTESMVGVKDSQRMTTMGFVQGMLAGGFIVLPPLTGLLIQYYSLATAFRVLAAGTALVTVYTLWLFASIQKCD